jgi:hypothetical protein
MSRLVLYVKIGHNTPSSNDADIQPPAPNDICSALDGWFGGEEGTTLVK